MLEAEKGSESYEHQVQRIMRDIPESERRVLEGSPRIRENVWGDICKNNGVGVEVELSDIKKVQSVIYKADPSLLIQSVLPSK